MFTVVEGAEKCDQGLQKYILSRKVMKNLKEVVGWFIEVKATSEHSRWIGWLDRPGYIYRLRMQTAFAFTACLYLLPINLKN